MISTVKRWLDEGETVILITVSAIWGSTPRASGTRMAVSSDGIVGTIGGGRLEWEAMARARQMIAEWEALTHLDMPLGPALGQCCGGRMSLILQRFDDDLLRAIEAEESAADEALPRVLVCGIGHVGKELVAALDRLPVRLYWWDERAEETVVAEKAERYQGDPLGLVAEMDAVIIMTHIHSRDYEIAEAALASGGAAYVGMIGSRTKRARFEKWALARGSVSDFSGLTSPIGQAGIDDKRPEVIAALTAAEVITALGKVAHARANPTLKVGG